jgi:hypothetical protein
MEMIGVDAASPADVTCCIVFLRPFSLEHRFCLAVSPLLSQVRAGGRPAAVPDDCCRSEAELPAMSLNAPAKVDVVACYTKAGVESSNGS